MHDSKCQMDMEQKATSNAATLLGKWNARDKAFKCGKQFKILCWGQTTQLIVVGCKVTQLYLEVCFIHLYLEGTFIEHTDQQTPPEVSA